MMQSLGFILFINFELLLIKQKIVSLYRRLP